jgi:hypothetical protein
MSGGCRTCLAAVAGYHLAHTLRQAAIVFHGHELGEQGIRLVGGFAHGAACAPSGGLVACDGGLCLLGGQATVLHDAAQRGPVFHLPRHRAAHGLRGVAGLVHQGGGQFDGCKTGVELGHSISPNWRILRHINSFRTKTVKQSFPT